MDWLLAPIVVPLGALVLDGGITLGLIVLLLATFWKFGSSVLEWKAFLRELDERSDGRIAEWCFPRDRELCRKLDEVFQAVRKK